MFTDQIFYCHVLQKPLGLNRFVPTTLWPYKQHAQLQNWSRYRRVQYTVGKTLTRTLKLATTWLRRVLCFATRWHYTWHITFLKLILLNFPWFYKVAPGCFLLSYRRALIINRVPVSNIHCHHFLFLLILSPCYILVWYTRERWCLYFKMIYIV